MKAVVELFMKAYSDIKIKFYDMPNSTLMFGTLHVQFNASQIDIAIMNVSVGKAATEDGIFAPMDKTV